MSIVDPLRSQQKLCEQASDTEHITMFTTILHIKVQEPDSQIGACQKTFVCTRTKFEIKVGEVTHRFALPQFLLSTVKVKVHVQALHKLCDWIFVGVRLLK